MTTVSRSKVAPKARLRPPQRRADSEATRQRILDVAERLFADAGFHATSIREIATHAQCQFALIGYHFGSKEELLDQVIARRSEVLNQERRRRLEELLALHGAQPIPLRALITSFVSTLMTRADTDDDGWRNYTRLIAVVAANAQWKDLTDRHFNAVARQYLAQLQRTLPGVAGESLYRAFSFSVGTMLSVCARSDRIETLSDGTFDSRQVASLTDDLCVFLEGGFAAMARA
jgi:AcrR family transcriptional regulator